MLSFFPRGVLDEILNLIESISEEFPSYSLITLVRSEIQACLSLVLATIISKAVSLELPNLFVLLAVGSLFAHQG